MGGSSSKTSTELISEVISKHVTKNIQNCTTVVNVKQKLSASGKGSIIRIGKNATINQTVSISINCIQKNVNVDSIKKQINHAISQTSTASGESILSVIGASGSDAISTIRNVVNNVVTVENIQNCAAKVNQQQLFEASNGAQIIFDPGSSANQTLNMMNNCFADMTTKIMDQTGISSDIDQVADAKTTSPFAFISDIVGEISPFKMISLFFILIITVIIGVVVYPMVKSDTDLTYPYTSNIV
jgi:hypothetical protein